MNNDLGIEKYADRFETSKQQQDLPAEPSKLIISSLKLNLEKEKFEYGKILYESSKSPSMIYKSTGSRIIPPHYTKYDIQCLIIFNVVTTLPCQH